MDRNEPVEVELDRLIGQTEAALIVEVEGEEFFVGKSKVENLEELQDELEKPAHRRKAGAIVVPRWLAEDNGWAGD